MVLKQELGFFAFLLVFGLAVSLLAYSIAPTDPLTLVTRLLALNGYIALAIAVIITPFIKELTVYLKRPFTKIHHSLAAAALLLITLHPIAVFAQSLNPTVFLPNFNSVFLFFYNGGIVALLLIYMAVAAVLLRRKIISYWRPFHMLMYLALFVGVVHANLRGTDFSNVYIEVLFDALFVLALFAFALKRWQFYRLKRRMQKFRAVSAAKNKGSK